MSPLLYQWRVRRRTGHTHRDHLKETLHQEPHVKMKTFFGDILTIFWKMPTFLEHFRPFSCTQTPTCPQSPLPLKVNHHSKVLRWLVKVGMLTQSEYFLESTLAVSCMKIQGAGGVARPPASCADAHVYTVCYRS